MDILLIRHGETDGNLKGFVQTADTPLNKVGRSQASSLQTTLAARNIKKIISSDFIRARQTIEEFAKKHNISYEHRESLRERDFGELKGKFYRDINSVDVFKDDFVPPGGESFQQFKDRVDVAWSEIISMIKGQIGQVVVVTHGLVIKDLLKRKLLLGNSLNKKYEIVPNTSVTTFEPIHPYKVTEFASIKHLKHLKLNRGIA